jgi:hypothetical protein
MSNPSNLYAEKIYSEHPVVLWALDDQLDYIGLISEAQRNLATLWTGTNATLAESFNDLKLIKESLSNKAIAKNKIFGGTGI